MLAMRHTERLAEAGAAPSPGSVGDAYDDAPAESVIGLFKTEAIHRRGPWRGFDDVEHAPLEWVAWFDQQRLLARLAHVPPAEFEERVYHAQATPPVAAALDRTSLLRTRGGSPGRRRDARSRAIAS